MGQQVSCLIPFRWYLVDVALLKLYTTIGCAAHRKGFDAIPRKAKWVTRQTRQAQVAGVGCGHRSACPEGPSNLGADSLAPLFETLSHTGCPLYFFGSREDGFAHPSGRLAPRSIDLPAVIDSVFLEHPQKRLHDSQKKTKDTSDKSKSPQFRDPTPKREAGQTCSPPQSPPPSISASLTYPLSSSTP